MGSLNIAEAKVQFLTLMERITDSQLPQFAIWLDIKLAEYKINGDLTTDSTNFSLSHNYPAWILRSLRQNLSFLFADEQSNAASEIRVSDPTPRKRKRSNGNTEARIDQNVIEPLSNPIVTSERFQPQQSEQVTEVVPQSVASFETSYLKEHKATSNRSEFNQNAIVASSVENNDKLELTATSIPPSEEFEIHKDLGSFSAYAETIEEAQTRPMTSPTPIQDQAPVIKIEHSSDEEPSERLTHGTSCNLPPENSLPSFKPHSDVNMEGGQLPYQIPQVGNSSHPIPSTSFTSMNVKSYLPHQQVPLNHAMPNYTSPFVRGLTMDTKPRRGSGIKRSAWTKLRSDTYKYELYKLKRANYMRKYRERRKTHSSSDIVDK